MKEGKIGIREEIDQLRVSALTTKMSIEWATKEIKELNKRVWDEKYLNGEYLVAIGCAIDLRDIARFKGLDNEVSSWCDSTIAFSEYRDDKNNGWKNSRSWRTAKRGLETAVDPLLRSLLLEPAGLCQAYLVSNQDEPAEKLLRECLVETVKSRDQGRVGEATNAFALLLMSEKRFKEAIPYLEKADQIQEEAGNDRLCGNANNNIVRCYVEIAKKKDKTLEEIVELCEKAMARADKAISKYNKPLLDHTIGARGRKAEVLVLLGKAKHEQRYFEEAIEIRKENHLRWFEINQIKKAANEWKYIEEIGEEIRGLSAT